MLMCRSDVTPVARYAKTDAASLAYLRRELLRPHYTAAQVGVATAVAASAVGGLTTFAAEPVSNVL